ncbi:MAG: FAD-dependent oxidoreductase [Sphingosinicella sp.]
MKKGQILLLLAIAGAIAAFFWFDLDLYLNLNELKSHRDEALAFVEERPLTAILAFFLFYVALTAISMPGAAVLTIAGGALFGLTRGTIIVSFASTIGASLAFLSSRYLLRDWVCARFPAQVAAIDRGVARDGAFYLLTLRLITLIPFFLVNLAMGLTAIRLPVFFFTSQAGMLPATIIYIYAGTQLAAIEHVSDILSPGLILAFLLLGLLPLMARLAVRRLQQRRAYRGFKRPKRFDRNLVVIGGGAGGLVTAYVAAATKAKVTLIEAEAMGGDCLNTGCVPSKTLIRSARAAHEVRTADRFGIRAPSPDVDFAAVMRRVRDAIATIAPHDSAERYRGLGVDVRLGHGRILDPWTVEVGGERLTTRAIVTAAGGEPVIPPVPGLEKVMFLTSDTLWAAMAERETAPKRLAILGGGPIGCELAQAFARLGSQVTLVEAEPRLLAREDGEAAEALAAIMRDEGVDLRLGQPARRVEPGRLFVGEGEEVAFDELIVAAGRKPRLAGYGLDGLGIDTGKTLETNAFLETIFPNIYAVGDVEGRYQFTHVSAHQAWHAAVNALFGSVRRFRVDERVLPRVTFTDPELAQVGHHENSARAAGIAFETVRYDLAGLDRAVTESEARGFVKLLVEPNRDRILGATILGHNAGETIALVALAIKHGIGLNRLLSTVFAYPTMAEAVKMAAGQWRRDHAPQRLLGWAERWHRWRRR